MIGQINHVTMARSNTLCLLLCTWMLCVIDAAVHPSGLIPLDVGCEIAQPFSSPLVSAYLEKPVQATGCQTNALLQDKGAELHGIHYSTDRKRMLELNIHDYEDQGFNRPAIIVLSSNMEVNWQIRIKRNHKKLGKLHFIVSKGSGLRFANKKMESRPRITKSKKLPKTLECLQWLTKEYAHVTSFTVLEGGNVISLVVGKVSGSSSPSSTSSSSSSVPCSIEPSRELSASAMERTARVVEGCLGDNQASSDRRVYVVELKHMQSEEPCIVDLELRRQSRHAKDKEFVLVLKSPSHVTWRVVTRKLQGYINIVTNNTVDISGIRIRTVAVRAEELDVSGRDLLKWVTIFLGRVALYTSINDTNHIEVTLPNIPSKPAVEKVSPSVRWEKSDIAQITATLKHALRKECDQTSVTVALDKNVLTILGLKKSLLSLSDSQCRAEENATHVYLQSSPSRCGTNYMENRHGQKVYINMLVVHEATRITDDTELETGEGSGQEFSGSGDGNGPLILDDEDLQLQPLEIDFMCTVEEPLEHPVVQLEPVFRLELFPSELYEDSYPRFPVDVQYSHSRLYLQAFVTSDPRLRAHLQHCWLAEYDVKHSLVKSGCAVDDSVVWHQNSVRSQPGSPPNSERFSFTLKKFATQSTSINVFLKCELTVCCDVGPCTGYNFPSCEVHRNDCAGPVYRSGSPQTEPPKRLVILGPIKLKEVTERPPVVVSLEDKPAPSERQEHVVIEGLDSATVIGIAFAAFVIGVLMMGALWFIHAHSGSLFTSGRFKRSSGNRSSAENDNDYGETTPGSSAPISA